MVEKIEEIEKNIVNKINLGGGATKLDGFINIDNLKIPEVDIVADLNKGIPLPNDSVEEVFASSVLEHLDDTPFTMEEIFRVCKNNAKVIIIVPHFKSTAAFQDPTHKRFFCEKTFQYFDRDIINAKRLPDYQFKCDFRVKKITYKYYTPGNRGKPLRNRFFIRFFWDIIKTMTVELVVVK